MGSASVLAKALNISLRMVSDDVRLIMATSGAEIYEEMRSIGEGDVMVAISFPRYSGRISGAVSFAHNSGANVIAITDSPVSPIASAADQTLYAKSDMASFADSLAAPLSLINALVVAVSRKKRDELTVRLRQLEEIWSEYNVYDTNRG